MRKKILIVEDEPHILLALKRLLEANDYKVITAFNGVEGLALVKKENPDLILTDILMPEMDGFEFYKKLKTNKKTFHIPILICTARSQMKETFQAMGADGFIAKPFGLREVITQIESILEKVHVKQKFAKEAKEKSQKKILAIRDQNNVLEKMVQNAQRAGYTIETATSDTEAIAKAVKLVPDIIFVDVQFRQMSSTELINVLQRLPLCEKKPIIGYSYSMQKGSQQQKDLKIISASTKFIQSGGAKYIGNYDDENFLKVCIEYSS